MPKNLLSIKSAKQTSFVYTPPLTAYGTARILIKTTFGESAVSHQTFATVLRGLRRVNPDARIIITAENIDNHAIDDLLDQETMIAKLGDLMMGEYPNPLENPIALHSIIAPAYMGEYACSISMARLADPLHEQASLHNILPAKADSPVDLYFCLGHLFTGAVLELNNDTIIWGDSPLAVDEAAYRILKLPAPDYITAIRSHG